MKIPVYFYNVGFGFLIYDSNSGSIQPSPHPFLICGVLDATQQVIIHSNGSVFPIATAEPFEVNLMTNPNIDKIPLQAFRPAGVEIDPN